MMSVFCSNTLILTPECWKCILRGPDFKIFPETHAFDMSFSFSTYSKAFATYLKSYWKPCGNDEDNKADEEDKDDVDDYGDNDDNKLWWHVRSYIHTVWQIKS